MICHQIKLLNNLKFRSMSNFVVRTLKRSYMLMFAFIIVSCSKAGSNDNPQQIDSEDTSKIGNIKLGPLTSVYKDPRMPYTLDCSWATLKNEDGTITFFETAMAKNPYYFRHKGTLNDPLATELEPFKVDHNGYNNVWPSGCWIPNIYKVSENLLIGITHREDLYPANNNPIDKDRFYIGISVSRDNGNNWKYLGDVISVRGNNLQQTSNPRAGSNVAGCPMLIVDDYIYIYYDETNDEDARALLAVARAKISDLLTAVENDKTTPFFKYYNGKWEEPGINGSASCIIPDFQIGYDFHSDATYCKALGKYLITVQTHGFNKLLLYQSTDGVNWEKNPIVLDNAEGFMHPYSCFVGFGDESNDDCTEVNKEFYIYICRKNLSNYDYDEIYYRKITIE